jgi:plastocyanin
VSAVGGLAAATLAPSGAEERRSAPRDVKQSKTIALGGYAVSRRSVDVPAPPRDGYITSMRAYVVDEQGREVPQERVMLHHVLFMNKGRFSGDRTSDDCKPQKHEKFYGTGEEDQELVLPPGYGYRVRKGDRWRLSWMLMNHNASSERVRMAWEYTLAEPSADITPVTPHWISIGCDKGKIFNVPGGGSGGKTHTRSRTWRVPSDGRIVAAGAHAHGGVHDVSLEQPGCRGRQLLRSSARYGMPDDPIYKVSPVLHEPSPRSMSFENSSTGWAVKAGERLRLDALYDNTRPHMGVMGIMHVYIAPPKPGAAKCAPLPTDVKEERRAFLGGPGREAPPAVTMDLSERGDDGVARPIAELSGPPQQVDGDVEVDVRDYAFSPRKLSVPSGATVRWRFDDAVQHDVTVASAPRGFASMYLKGNKVYSRTLTVPGTYRLLCSLHAVDMAATIEVRP